MRKTLLALAALAVAAAPALAAPQTYTLDTNHSSVSFTIRHFVSRVAGKFDTFSGTILVDKDNPAASKVNAEIGAKSIDTGVEKRDNHLRSPDFFDVEKFPTITFASTEVVPNGKDKTTVKGNLTMHGITKPVALDVTWNGFAGPKAGFEAKVTLNRKDFGIGWNKLVEGMSMVGEDVEIRILVEANLEEPKAEEKPAAPAASPK